MRDVKTVASEVETTIADFKSHSYISAISEIGTIASGLSQDIQDCEGAISAYDSADYYTMGQDIGNGTKEALVGKMLGLSTDGAEQFAEGFFNGIFGTVEGAVKCIRDIKTVASEVETTVTDLKAHQYITAIEEIGTIAGGLSFDIMDCSSASTEAQQLSQQLETLYEYASAWDITFGVGKNILVNGVDIYNDITGAISSYDSADYYTMGQDIGNAMKDAVVGVQVGDFLEDDVEPFVNGFLDGILEGFDMGLKCIRDAKRLVTEVKTTVSDLTGHKYIAAVREVGTIAGELGGDIKDCMDAVS